MSTDEKIYFQQKNSLTMQVNPPFPPTKETFFPDNLFQMPKINEKFLEKSLKVFFSLEIIP